MSGPIYLYGMTITKFLHKAVDPRAVGEDDRRREFIFNVLIMGLLVLGTSSFLLVLFKFITMGSSYQGVNPIFVFIPVAIYSTLYALSRRAHYRFASYTLIAIIFLIGTATMYMWGIQLNIGTLIYALVVVMAGILIGTRFAVIVTALSALLLLSLVYLAEKKIHLPDISWNQATGNYADAITFSVALGIIALVSWLSNREIYKSLNRARKSEAMLKEERDLLEVRVEERTKELKETQLEKMMQLYRFAEFGRISAGLLHDLTNPLTAVELNLEQLNSKKRSGLVKRALAGIHHMEEYVDAARKQFKKQTEMKVFSVQDEILQAIKILSQKARRARVGINMEKIRPAAELYGNPIKFNQLMVNLLSNAVDAYDRQTGKAAREVSIGVKKNKKDVVITVKDQGRGFPQRNAQKIFEPFYTTKKSGKGMGIGLSISKNIVNNDFFGTITAKSSTKSGTTFTIVLPVKLP